MRRLGRVDLGKIAGFLSEFAPPVSQPVPLLRFEYNQHLPAVLMYNLSQSL